MKFKNPILQFDFSDPDAIRDGADYYLVASSFNHLPGLPILHSINLVDWEIINYALPYLDEDFNKVAHGNGVWAPSIRKHNGLFYIIYPDPDKGIFEVHASDIRGEFSKPHCIMPGKGFEDPCPIWIEDKCYMVFSFVKSRIGFNSLLAVVECDYDFTHTIGDYKIVYDGHNDNPTIEGPKFYYRNGYYYIMAPSGSVKGGWQTCLRSKNVYGPYESKIVLYQGDTLVNGPHQGALIDLDDSNQKYAFIHFQDMRAYGRICHLEPATFINDWPICGNVADPLLAGTPLKEADYLVEVKSDAKVQISDDFKGPKLSLMFQRPSNIDNFYSVDNGLILKMNKTEYEKEINLIPYALLTKVPALEFNVSTLIEFTNMSSGDHVGFTVMGEKYSAVDFKKDNDTIIISLINGEFKKEDTIIDKVYINESSAKINAQFRNKDIYDLIYSIHVNGVKVFDKVKAYAGRWIGTKIGFYAYSENESKGFAKVAYYDTNIIK